MMEESARQSQQRRWMPRLLSNFTLAFGGIGAASVALFLLAQMLHAQESETLSYIEQIILVHQQLCLLVGIGLIACSIAAEALSRLRTPPPTWRVKQELIRVMGDMGLLELNDTSRWRGKFAVAPIGRYNKRAKCFTLPFLLRCANATEDKFKNMEQSIAGFARACDCTIERVNSRRIYNFKLTLWYSPNPYTHIEKLNPFKEDQS